MGDREWEDKNSHAPSPVASQWKLWVWLERQVFGFGPTKMSAWSAEETVPIFGAHSGSPDQEPIWKKKKDRTIVVRNLNGD